MALPYQITQPERVEIDALPGIVVLEFGTGWCSHCQAGAPVIATVLQDAPAVRHLKIEDGPGRALGRSFRVKLWPTVIVLKDGKELARVVRPSDGAALRAALALVAES